MRSILPRSTQIFLRSTHRLLGIQVNLTKWVTNYTKIGAGGWLCWCLTTTDAPSEVALPGQPPLLCCWHLFFAISIAFSWTILTVDLVRVDFEKVDLERWPRESLACETTTWCRILLGGSLSKEAWRSCKRRGLSIVDLLWELWWLTVNFTVRLSPRS